MSNRISELRNLSAEQLFVRAGEVLPPWVAFILVLAIAWQLVRITWLFFPNSNADNTALINTPTRTSTQAQTIKSYDIGRIVATNLFGARNADVPPVPTDDFAELDDTQLNLVLRGTIAAGDDQVALAIIADDKGEEKVYSIGEPIGGGRKLHSVLRDQAILNHNGKLEALRLPKEYETTRSSSRTRASSRPSTSRANTIRSVQQSIANNPAKLTDLIRPQPVFSNGKQLGYRVYPGRRRQQFVSLGLKPGDLVTEINGSPLNDPARGAEIFKSLAESNQVTVTVERNGTPEVLVLDTEQLSLEDGQQR
ncbi:MAG: type II secretion system protein GspC [Gammaproteobacteria bacterium]|nr:type II secretion system protein GspC [Gammaproteobacteria bacterium]